MKLKKSSKIIIIAISIIVFILLALFGAFFYLISPVKKCDNCSFEVTIPSGASMEDIAKILKDNNLIRHEKIFIYYTKITKANNIYAASYIFDTSMDLKKLVDTLLSGGTNPDQISITFKEGINMRKVAKTIEANTTNTYDDVLNTLLDKEYINSLIKNEKYWFITDEIKNENIYYPLEGYLYPETYYFNSKDVSVKEIFNAMLDQMGKVLNNYKEDIEKSDYTTHELLTVASLAELEGSDKDDRKYITSVFYNRLDKGMSLGSDVTTYYAVKVEMNERDLYQKELNAFNPYNTRGPLMAGKLPVGPISTVASSSIEAALYPNQSDYLYFVADKNRKVHFTRTSNEHGNMITKLKNEGLWYEW